MSKRVLLCFFLIILSAQVVFSAPPTVTIESGPELSSIQQRPTFSWSGVDADGTVTKYYYGLNIPTPTTATTETSFTPATDLDYGTHTFYLQAEDNDGERSEVSSYIFVVEESPNLLKNGDFSQVLDSAWRFKPTNVALRVNEQCILSLSSPKADVWDASIGQYKIPITKGDMYEVSFKAKAASATTILWIVQHNGKWTEYGSDKIELTPTMKSFSYRFMMSEPTDPEACFFIQFGHSTQQIILDDIAIKRVTAGTQYKIDASVSGKGKITPSGNTTVFEGTNQTFKFQSDNSALYPLVDLIVDGKSVDSTYSYTFENITGNHSIKAVFGEKKKFTITTAASGNNGRGISSGFDSNMGKKEVVEGTSKTFTIAADNTPTDGSPSWSVLKDVIVDGVSMGAGHTEHTFENISKNHTIVAVYEDRVGTPNLIEWGSWQAQCDKYGSHLSGSDGVAITLKTDIIRNGVASERIDLTTEGVFNSHPWGQIACNVPADPATKLAGVDHIVIEYAIGGGLYLSPAVVLYDPSLGEGFSYRSPELHSYGSEVNHIIIRDTIAVSEFSRPAGAPNSPLRLSNISDILVHSRSVNNLGWTWMKPQIHDLRLFGYTGGGYTVSNKRISSSVGTGKGMILPFGEQPVEKGTEKTFYFSPEEGHRVKEVRVNGVVVTVTENSYTFDNVIADQTIEVDFEEIPTFSIITAVTGGTVLPGENIVVEQGTRQRITYSPNAGNSLVSVTVDGVLYPDSTTSFTFDDVQKNYTVAIVYDGETVPTYMVNATFTGAGSISPSGQITVNEGEDLTFTIELEEGASFDSLKVAGTKVTPVMSYTLKDIRKNNSVEAFGSKTVQTNYTITASVDGNGTVTPSGETLVAEGASQRYAFAAAGGHRLDSVTVDGARVDSTLSYTFINVNANHSVKGYFSPIPTVTITSTVSGSGTISPAGTTVLSLGVSQNYTFAPAVGAKLDSVRVDGVSVSATDSYLFENVTKNHTIAVFFSDIVTYTIDASVVGGGTISPAGATVVPEGGSQIYNITVPQNVIFDSLLVDGAPVAKDVTYTFVNVVADATIVAYFTNQTVSVIESKQNMLNLTVGNSVWAEGSLEFPVIFWGQDGREIRSAEVKLFDAVGNKLMNMKLSSSDISSGETEIVLDNRLYASGQYLMVIVAESLEGEMRWFKAPVGVKR